MNKKEDKEVQNEEIEVVDRFIKAKNMMKDAKVGITIGSDIKHKKTTFSISYALGIGAGILLKGACLGGLPLACGILTILSTV